MQYNRNGWDVFGTDDPDYHPATGRWRAESFGVTMSASTEEVIRRLIDCRCEEYPPNGHGARVETYKHLQTHGDHDLFRRRANSKIYISRWTEETAYQMSAIGYESESEAIKALEDGKIEWSSVWTPA